MTNLFLNRKIPCGIVLTAIVCIFMLIYFFNFAIARADQDIKPEASKSKELSGEGVGDSANEKNKLNEIGEVPNLAYDFTDLQTKVQHESALTKKINLVQEFIKKLQVQIKSFSKNKVAQKTAENRKLRILALSIDEHLSQIPVETFKKEDCAKYKDSLAASFHDEEMNGTDVMEISKKILESLCQP